jgi:hypothetical protein
MHTVREHRRKVSIRANMRAGGPRMDVCIRDISSRGLMLQASVPPPRGTYVEIIGAEQTIVGCVIWTKDRRFGVRTRDRIDVSAAIRGIPAHRSDQGPASRPRTLCTAIARARKSPGSNNALAKAMEFAAIGALGATLVVGMAMATFKTLSTPLEHIEVHLGGAG